MSSRWIPSGASWSTVPLPFTMSELSVAVQHSLTIPIILWNNRGYGEIKRLMEERGDQPYASDLRTPDFVTLATAFGAQSEVVREPVALVEAVGRAFEADGPTLIEIPDWT
jgi:acetolactate synthase-1/2/3 large subunit